MAFGSGRDGYSFTGRYVDELEGQTKHGICPVLLFDAYRILWAYHTDLKRKWNKASPKPGELVTITRSVEPVPFGDEGRAQYEYTVFIEDEDNFDGLELLGAYMARTGGQPDDIPF